MSLSALPFLLLKTPVVGELLHQMRTTGFNALGNSELQMTLPQVKRSGLV